MNHSKKPEPFAIVLFKGCLFFVFKVKIMMNCPNNGRIMQ